MQPTERNLINSAWLNCLRRLVNDGQMAAPRGQGTCEMLGHKFVVPMNQPVLNLDRRRLGFRFMAAEAHWILTGDNQVETIAPYSKVISNFSDDGRVFFGAYGPKIIEQLGYAVDTLANDRDSRQAVINIWRECPPPSKDIPCTLSTQFLIRNGQLHQVVTMRSSDIWLGVPYDIFNFSCLAAAVIILLRQRGIIDLQLGYMYHTAGSRHLYSRDLERAINVLDDPVPDPRLSDQGPGFLDPDEYSSLDAFIEHLEGIKDNRLGLLNSSWLDALCDGVELCNYHQGDEDA